MGRDVDLLVNSYSKKHRTGFGMGMPELRWPQGRPWIMMQMAKDWNPAQDSPP